jgi:formylglycine-generating enzyme required for sulfatase activity
LKPLHWPFVYLALFTFIVPPQEIYSQTNFSAYNQLLPGSGLYFKMVPIQGGSFLMGSASTNKTKEFTDESPPKQITISPFWMGVFEVTRDEFDVYLKDESTSQNNTVDAITRPSPQYVDLTWGMGKEGGYPANSMSQLAALMYCKWLYQKTKIFYRLPTEAEWEYACKAGTNTNYYWGDDSTLIDKYAWYVKNSKNKYHPVGQKLPNHWGLYDMLGNIAEWTLDHYYTEAYSSYQSNDPMVVPQKAKYPKALRGGSFEDNASDVRSTKRLHSDPIWNRRDPQIPKSKWWLTEAKQVGFRLVRPLNQPTEEQVQEFFKTYLNL